MADLVGAPPQLDPNAVLQAEMARQAAMAAQAPKPLISAPNSPTGSVGAGKATVAPPPSTAGLPAGRQMPPEMARQEQKAEESNLPKLLPGVAVQKRDLNGPGGTPSKLIPGTQHINPQTGQYEETPYSIAQQAHPFTGLFARAENIGNPTLRVAAKIGSAIGGIADSFAGAMDPESQKSRMDLIKAPGEQAEQQQKIRLQAAQADEAEAKAKGQVGQEKIAEEAASKDLFPVRAPDGSITFQKAERGLTSEEYAKLPPDSQVSYAGYMAQSATDPTEKANWNAKLEAAKTGAQAGHVTAPNQQVAAPARVQQINGEIAQLPNLTKDEIAKFAPIAGATAEQVEKQLADAHALSAEKTKQIDQQNAAGAKALQDKVKALRPPIQKDYDATSGQIEKLDQAKTELASGNTGKAIGVVKILSGLASGTGSGVRITGAELNMLIKNTRGLGGDFQATWNKIVGGENIVLTPTQVTAMNELVDHVKANLNLKRGIADAQLRAIDSATTKDEAVQASNDLRRYNKAVETGKAYTRTEAEQQAAKRGISLEDAEKLYKKEGGVEVPE